MNALFYFAGYHWSCNAWSHWLLTVPSGAQPGDPEARYAAALAVLKEGYPEYSQWSGEFICLTPDEVFKEM